MFSKLSKVVYVKNLVKLNIPSVEEFNFQDPDIANFYKFNWQKQNFYKFDYVNKKFLLKWLFTTMTITS